MFPETPPLPPPGISNPFDTAPPAAENPFAFSGYQSGANSPGFFDIRFTRFITNIYISVIWCIVIATHFLGYGVTMLVMLYAMANIDNATGAGFCFLAMLVATVWFPFSPPHQNLWVVF